MAISATLVKELRERTGAGMMECKKALVETNGDIDAAIEAMRKSGQAKAAKKAARVAADGVVEIRIATDARTGVLVEINSETDFVAKDTHFAAFAATVADIALASGVSDVATLLQQTTKEGTTLDGAREALVAKVGENIQVRRCTQFKVADGHCLCEYRHGVRIGVIVDMSGGDATVGRDIAMHIAATNPLCVTPEQIPADVLAKEREIFRAQALDSGKPEAIVEKIIEGRVRKYFEEVTLVGQAFVKNTDITVAELLRQHGATVHQFARIEVGEGIEKKTENFAEEVQAQARGV
jgi:elongation factor Ts